MVLLAFLTHAGKWHNGYAVKNRTATYRGYQSFLGYYTAMTGNALQHIVTLRPNAGDYWSHGEVEKDCGFFVKDMTNASGFDLRPSPDNSTFESELFATRSGTNINAKH